MSLHNKIMNIDCSPTYGDSEPCLRLAYKVGHRDARHAAAELSLAADLLARAADDVLELYDDTPTHIQAALRCLKSALINYEQIKH